MSARRRTDAGSAPKPNERSLRATAAERAVADYLERHGCLIVALNLHIGRLELDVVARDGRVIAVVEVRTRGPGAWTTGFSSMDWKKRERVRRAGQRLWRNRYRHDTTVDHLRFDAASVTFDGDRPIVEYVKAAF